MGGESRPQTDRTWRLTAGQTFVGQVLCAPGTPGRQVLFPTLGAHKRERLLRPERVGIRLTLDSFANSTYIGSATAHLFRAKSCSSWAQECVDALLQLRVEVVDDSVNFTFTRRLAPTNRFSSAACKFDLFTMSLRLSDPQGLVMAGEIHGAWKTREDFGCSSVHMNLINEVHVPLGKAVGENCYCLENWSVVLRENESPTTCPSESKGCCNIEGSRMPYCRVTKDSKAVNATCPYEAQCTPEGRGVRVFGSGVSSALSATVGTCALEWSTDDLDPHKVCGVKYGGCCNFNLDEGGARCPVIHVAHNASSELGGDLPCQPLNSRMCEPFWHVAHIPCPFGTHLLGDVTLPTDADLIDYVCVAYGYIAITVGVLAFVEFCIRRTTRTLNFVFFVVFLVVTDEFVLKWLWHQPRPIGSCAITCGMPSSHSSMSMGYFFLMLFDAVWRVDAPTLSAVEASGAPGKGVTKPATTKLSLSPITERASVVPLLPLRTAHQLMLSRSAFIYWTIFWFIILIPIPFSRMRLRDHSASQIFAGIITGLLSAFVWFRFVRWLISKYRHLEGKKVIFGLIRHDYRLPSKAPPGRIPLLKPVDEANIGDGSASMSSLLHRWHAESDLQNFCPLEDLEDPQTSAYAYDSEYSCSDSQAAVFPLSRQTSCATAYLLSSPRYGGQEADPTTHDRSMVCTGSFGLESEHWVLDNLERRTERLRTPHETKNHSLQHCVSERQLRRLHTQPARLEVKARCNSADDHRHQRFQTQSPSLEPERDLEPDRDTHFQSQNFISEERRTPISPQSSSLEPEQDTHCLQLQHLMPEGRRTPISLQSQPLEPERDTRDIQFQDLMPEGRRTPISPQSPSLEPERGTRNIQLPKLHT